jgi:hypothetical protein
MQALLSDLFLAVAMHARTYPTLVVSRIEQGKKVHQINVRKPFVLLLQKQLHSCVQREI